MHMIFLLLKKLDLLELLPCFFLIADLGLLIFSHQFNFIIFIVSLIVYVYSFIYRKNLIEINKEISMILHKDSTITINSKNINVKNDEIDLNINYNSICTVYDVKNFIYIFFFCLKRTLIICGLKKVY